MNKNLRSTIIGFAILGFIIVITAAYYLIFFLLIIVLAFLVGHIATIGFDEYQKDKENQRMRRPDN